MRKLHPGTILLHGPEGGMALKPGGTEGPARPVTKRTAALSAIQAPLPLITDRAGAVPEAAVTYTVQAAIILCRTLPASPATNRRMRLMSIAIRRVYYGLERKIS